MTWAIREAPSPQWRPSHHLDPARPSTLWSPPCCLLSLAVFLCSLLPAQPAPSPHWCPCQSSIPQAWLHLPSRDGARRPLSSHQATRLGTQWDLGLWACHIKGFHQCSCGTGSRISCSGRPWAARGSHQVGVDQDQVLEAQNKTNPELSWGGAGGRPGYLEILDSP